MRLCFNGFCLGPQRPLAVEQSSQTVLTLSTAVDTFNVTTFFDKTFPTSNAYPQTDNNLHKLRENSSFFEKFRNINPEDCNSFQVNSSEFNLSANSSTMFSSDNNLQSHFADSQNQNDSQNNNTVNSSSQIELIKHDAVESLNNNVGNIYINECFDVSMRELDSDQHLTEKEKELIKVIQLKDIKIQELNQILLQKNDEIVNLKSHLDKFQSVFSGIRTGAMGRKIGRNIQQRQRIGISAEPQSESSMHDLLNVTFPKYEKDEK